MILPIYIVPQLILQKKTELVAEITPEIVQLAQNMRETMHNAQGVGLAAPQVGRPIALCVVEFPSEDPFNNLPFMVLVNPKVTWRSPRKVTTDEGCLSIPGLEGSVKRPYKVKVEALDLEGNQIEITSEDIAARIIQHEIDHLNGVLFTDYVPKNRLRKRPLINYPQL